MEEINIETKNIEINPNNSKNNTQMIAGAIVIAGLIIAGAIMLKGSSTPSPILTGDENQTGTPAPVSAEDRVMGNINAKVILIEYADFQCPFCDRFFKDSEQPIRNTYIKDGEVLFVYRDFAFLGEFVKPYVEANDESKNAAQAARCAGDQNKFWEYHDYLYDHQNGENVGAFSKTNLKSFAQALGLNTTTFNQCLDSRKYGKAVVASADEGAAAGVTGTPKGFILKDGKVFATIDGAEPLAKIKAKLDAALK